MQNYFFFVEYLFIKVFPILCNSSYSRIFLWQLRTAKSFNRFCVIVLLIYFFNLLNIKEYIFVVHLVIGIVNINCMYFSSLVK